jgi:hypothetical protein
MTDRYTFQYEGQPDIPEAWTIAQFCQQQFNDALREGRRQKSWWKRFARFLSSANDQINAF